MDFESSFLVLYNCNFDLNQCFQEDAPNSSSSCSHVHPLLLDFINFEANIMDNQEEIVASFLFLQLRSTLNHQRMQYMASIMRRFEMTIVVLMRHKDEELMNTNIKINELLESLKASKEDTKMWKRIAKENEAIASVFSNMLEEESTGSCFSSTAAVLDEKIAAPALVR